MGVKSTLRGEEGEGKGRLQPGATESASYLPGTCVDAEIPTPSQYTQGYGGHVQFSSFSNWGGGENRDTQRAPLTLGSESTGNLDRSD